MSIVRDNLMTRKGYRPYCGGGDCPTMPRTAFNGTQFVCRTCGWKSNFDKKFIDAYKQKWGLYEQ